MEELAPVILGAVFGAGLWLTVTGVRLVVLSALAVLIAGVVATIGSGEYQESWAYLLLDFAEAAFSVAIGYLVAARLLTAERRAKLIAIGRTTPAKTER